MQRTVYDLSTGAVTIVDLTAEEIAALPPPEPPPVPTTITFAQALIGLVSEGWITEADGRAWRDRTALPTVVQGVIAALPAGERFAAETRALAPSVVERASPLVLAIAAEAGKSSVQIDDFFRTFSAI